jgi:hypothetical protein
MISFIDAETKTEIYVNADVVKCVRETRGGTRIQFIDDTYVIVVDDLKTCVGKLTKKSSK